MIIVKFIVFIFFLSIFPNIITSSMKAIKIYFNKTKNVFRRIYRTLNVNKSSGYVWNELIKYHKSSEWRFGQISQRLSFQKKDKWVQDSR